MTNAMLAGVGSIASLRGARWRTFGALVCALSVALGFAKGAVAQGPADPSNVVPVEADGLVNASGTDYNATFSTSFTPQHIQPGEGFVYKGITTYNPLPTTGCQDGPHGTMPFGFYKVPAGATYFSSDWQGVQIDGSHESQTCADGAGFKVTTTHTVLGAATVGLEPGCYQGDNWNNDWYFPGSDSNSGSLSTLRVGNVSGGCAPTPQCKDTLQNDFDGLTDYPADPGCSVANDASELGDNECDNGEDDDGDSKVDWPADEGCASASEETEGAFTECENGVNDDFDGLVDLIDPGCSAAADPSELGDNECDNGVDDDLDGAVDWPLDGGCEAATGVSEKRCYHTEVKYKVTPGGRPDYIWGIHTSDVFWCAESGGISVRQPVPAGLEVPSTWTNALFAQFGIERYGGQDWAITVVAGEGTNHVHLETAPDYRECIDLQTVVTWVPGWGKLGTAAWRNLPRAVRVRIVSNGIGLWMYYMRATPSFTALDDELIEALVQRLLKDMKKALVDGVLVTICEHSRATVSIELYGDGTTGDSVFEDPDNFDSDWIRGDAGTEFIEPRKFGAAPRPGGNLTVVYDAPKAGMLVTTVKPRRTARQSQAQVLARASRVERARRAPVLAKGARRVRDEGPIAVTASKTRAGKRVVAAGRAVNVWVIARFTPNSGQPTTKRIKARFGVARP